MPEFGYMDAGRAGSLHGNGPKETISRTVVGSEVIPFGRAVFGYPGDDKSCVLPQTDTNTLTLDGVLVASNVITITVNDSVYTETFVTDSATTLAALVAQLNEDASMIASLNSLVITITKKGETIVASGAITLGATQADVTAGTPAISGNLVYLGASIAIQKQTNLPSTDASYAVGEVASILSLGDMQVETDGSAVVQSKASILKTVVGVGKFTVAGSGQAIEGWYKESVPNETNLIIVHLDGGLTVIS